MALPPSSPRSPIPVPPAQRRNGEAALAILDADLPSHRVEAWPFTTPGGRDFRLFLALPRGEAPPAGYPILYLLDGNAAFDALAPAHLAAVPGLALAGIGYETALRFDVMARVHDYTPAPIADPRGRKTGGADAFLDLLTGAIRHEVEARVPVDPGRRGLWGHSLAGLCTLYALLARPGAFAAHVAASPSIWWGDEWLLNHEAAHREARPGGGGGARVLVMLGDAERRSNPDGPRWTGPAPHTLRLIERLVARPGLVVTRRIFPGLGHAATLGASLAPALAFAAEG